MPNPLLMTGRRRQVFEVANLPCNPMPPPPVTDNGPIEFADLVFSISNEAFSRIRDYLDREIGIQLTIAKKQMVASRLAKRLSHHKLSSYGEYFQLTLSGELPGEKQVMLDLLTTNETYLFREPAHFDFLCEHILHHWKRGQLFRAWSAACSSGEEAYSMAMVMNEQLGDTPWEIFGSDVSTRVLKLANDGRYTMDRVRFLPKDFLHKYCLKGVRSQTGTLLICKRLRQYVHFGHLNLKTPLPEEIGQFDVIFLRNVLIYFDTSTRQDIVKRLVQRLKPGGHFFVSHTETITGMSNQLELAAPSVYRKR